MTVLRAFSMFRNNAEIRIHTERKKSLSIQNQIKKLRHKHNLSQRALAEGIFLSPSYIGDIETGRTSPSLRTLETIAEYFNISVSYLIESKCCHHSSLENEKDYCFMNDYSKHDCPLYMTSNNDYREVTLETSVDD